MTLLTHCGTFNGDKESLCQIIPVENLVPHPKYPNQSVQGVIQIVMGGFVTVALEC